MQYPNLNEQFKNIGNDIRDNIPHITIGKQGISTQKNTNIPKKKYKPLPKQENVHINDKNTKKPYSEDDIIEKIRKWALIIIICVVVGYAVLKILNMFIGGN